MLKGTILKESLSDEQVLDHVEIVHAEVWRVEHHAPSVEYCREIGIPESQIDWPD